MKFTNYVPIKNCEKCTLVGAVSFLISLICLITCSISKEVNQSSFSIFSFSILQMSGKIVNLIIATRATIHNELSPVTNFDKYFRPQVHWMFPSCYVSDLKPFLLSPTCQNELLADRIACPHPSF